MDLTATVLRDLYDYRDRLTAAIDALDGGSDQPKPRFSPAARAKISAAMKKAWQRRKRKR